MRAAHAVDDPLDRVLTSLEQVTGRVPRARSGYWTAACPAHEDKNPSLSVRQGDDGRVLLNCHAGCEADAVVRALGMTLADLFTERSRERFKEDREVEIAVARMARPVKRTTTVYPYHDEAGTLLYETVRVEDPNGKTFSVRTPLGRGHAAGLNGARPVPYRLPEVLAGIAAGAPVFVCEGEKAADAARELGLIGTTNAFGAGKWRDEWAPMFSGATVYVLPDNDPPGQQHADQVVASLEPAADSVTVLDLPGLPHGGDLADWVAAGNGREDLRAVARKAAEQATPRGPIEVQFGNDSAVAAWPWPEMGEAAWQSAAGRWAQHLHETGSSEADPAAVLVQVLVGVAAMMGPGPHLLLGTSRVPAKFNALVVGDTATGRKGTAWGDALDLLRTADSQFFADRRMTGGFGSGEAFLGQIADPASDTLIETDRRLLVMEGEFAKVLATAERTGSTLSAVIRELFDCYPIANHTKGQSVYVSDHHVGIVAHITPAEFTARLTDGMASNGFANRFLLVASERTRLLSRIPPIDDAVRMPLAAEVGEGVTFARNVGLCDLTTEGWDRWDGIYTDLEGMHRPPLVKSLTTRAPVLVLRIALIHALLGRRSRITPDDLNAALAIVDYGIGSALHFFGHRLGDPVADKLLRAAREAGKVGLTGTQRAEMFGRNKKAEELESAMRLLTDLELAAVLTVPPQGRGKPLSVLVAAEHLQAALTHYGPHAQG